MLYRYDAGGSQSGWTFTNASANGVPSYVDANGVVHFVNANTPRDGNYVGGVRTLLLESSRTNLFLQSETLDNATVQKYVSTVTANATTSPANTLTADKLAETAVNDTHYCYESIAVSASTAYTASAYLKATERGWGYVVIYNASDATFRRAFVNLATGALGTVSAGGTATVTAVANGFYRVTLTYTAPVGATTVFAGAGIATADATPSYLGTIGSGIYPWGVGFEAGSFGSSYTPSTTAAVTRAVDALSIAGISVSGTATLFYRYWNLATAAWVDVAAAYTSGAAIVPPVDRAYQTIGILAGSLSAAQCAALLGVA